MSSRQWAWPCPATEPSLRSTGAGPSSLTAAGADLSEAERAKLAVPRLASARVRTATRRRYEFALIRLLSCLRLAFLPRAWGAGLWDEVLTDYVELLFDRKKGRADAEAIPHAVLWARPRLGRPAGAVLPVTLASLKGWSCPRDSPP